MAEDNSNAEAHLIGSLIDTLGNSTEDDVFIAGNTPNSSQPIADFALGDSACNTDVTAVPPSYTAVPPGPFPYQMEFYPSHTPSFWPNSIDGRGGYRQYPLQMAQNIGNDPACWIGPVRGCLPPSNMMMQQQMYQQIYPPRQQGRQHDFPMAQNGGTFSNNQNAQWESFYTPFGPIRSQGHNNPVSEFEMKKRSASVCSLSHVSMANTGPDEKVSSSSSLVTAPPTTASSPSLPSKGRSYRDVAKSKADPKNGNSYTQGAPLKRNEKESLDASIASGTETGTNSLEGNPRSFSGPNRENSSDSTSEFGGSENGISAAQAVALGVEDIVAGRLGDGKEAIGYEDCNNVLKKNAATTTSSVRGDFKKIMRRKGSQTMMIGRDPSPVLASVSRYAVLGKNTPAALMVKSSRTIENSPATPVRLLNDEYQSQRVKLNNEDVSSRFNSKSPTRKAAYINNDLSWPGKVKSTNKTNEGNDEDDDPGDESGERRDNLDGEQLDEGDTVYSQDGTRNDSGKQKLDGPESGTRNRKKTNAGSQVSKGPLKRGKTKRGESGDVANKRRRCQQNPIIRWINYILTIIICYLRDVAFWLIDLVADIGNQLWEIIVFFVKRCAAKVSMSSQRAWYSMGERLKRLILCIRQKEWSILLWWRSRRKKRTGSDNELGLEENIELPNTGEEALKRLLSCRGQDAYSILGLRPDCTDDDVKYYYRRQAILVHPDKNACYGSDEAFKILAAAFELIGTTERRKTYDLQNLHRTKAMKDLQDMLAKLKEKMEEIRSTMHCDCGRKHKRFPTERELAYARYCRKCGQKHHAREGDIWAESHWFGFLWYYYACMDGAVYDITEWAGCQKNNLKHMKPDTHLVQYRLITGRNAHQFHQQQHQQQNAAGASPSAACGHGNGTEQRSKQHPEGGARPNNTTAEDLLNLYWEERLGTGSKNITPSATSMYLPPRASSAGNFGGLNSLDFSAPTQSKFNPPPCPSGDSRPRKAGRRRKPRV